MVAGTEYARQVLAQPEVVEAFRAGLVRALEAAMEACDEEEFGKAVGRVGLRLVLAVAHGVQKNEALVKELILLREEVIIRAMDPAVATKMVTALEATLIDEDVRVAGHRLVMTLGNELVHVAEDVLQDETVIKWLAEHIGGLVTNTLQVTRGGVREMVSGISGTIGDWAQDTFGTPTRNTMSNAGGFSTLPQQAPSTEPWSSSMHEVSMEGGGPPVSPLMKGKDGSTKSSPPDHAGPGAILDDDPIFG